MAIVFGFWQVYLGKRALIPVELFKNRTEVGGSIAIFMLMMGMVSHDDASGSLADKVFSSEVLINYLSTMKRSRTTVPLKPVLTS